MARSAQTETLGCVHDWSVHACQTNGSMSAWCQNPTSSPASFDHLVGASENVSCHHEVEPFRGLEDERKLDNSGPLYRDIIWLALASSSTSRLSTRPNLRRAH